MEWIDSRPSVSSTEISTGTQLSGVVDHRTEDAADGLSKLLAGLSEPPLIWGEDDLTVPAISRDRVVSEPQTLVVWTTPPGRRELQQVLRMARPRALHLFAVDPPTTKEDRFMACLAGLCKHTMRHHEGRVSFGRLAAATAHREETVRAGLASITGQGNLTVIRQDRESVTLGEGLQADEETAVRAEADVRELLTETAAYREFFATTPVDELIQTIEASVHPAGNRPSVAYWRPWLPIRHGLEKSIHQPLKILKFKVLQCTINNSFCTYVLLAMAISRSQRLSDR